MTIVNNQEKTYKQPSTGAIVGGTICGMIVQGLANKTALRGISPKIVKEIVEISKALTDDEFKTVQTAVDKTIEISGLSSKGVCMIRAGKEDSKQVKNILQTAFNNNILTRHFPQIIKDHYVKMISSMITNGQNAAYVHDAKTILTSKKSLALALFHETGHAMNHKLSTVGNMLRKSKMLGVLTLPIALIALLKTKKAPNQEPKGKTDKTTTFIKNNAGKLTFLTFIPLILEEGLASHNGNIYAKKLLKPELAKKVTRTNAIAISTYLILATLSSIGIALGVKLKDSIAKPKLVKKRSRAEQQ